MIKIQNNISKMADLLRSGHKMLNMACPICNNPIFQRRNGETFCPTCNREVSIIESKSHQINSKTNVNIDKNIIKEKSTVREHNDAVIFLKQVIIEKIDLFSKKLKKETQIDMIERYAKLLLDFYDILNKFSNLDI
ncbi:MAG: Sjogren's syndrome/scleroderma autoantigen 1 family protein [Promethearchaeota archaeon]